MTVNEFEQLVEAQTQSLQNLPKALQALGYDKQGDWNQAHQIVQNAGDADSAWVHAYLHRKEGDSSNARYWYNRSGRLEAKVDLNQEWEQITQELLEKI